MAKSIVSAEQMSSIISYDATSPSGLRWLVDRGVKAKAGDPAGTLWSGGQCLSKYWVVTILCRQYYAHRVIWMLHNGDIPEGMVSDHVNGRSDDNHIENLRCVTVAVNSRNQFAMRRNKTGVIGVSRDTHNGQYVASWYEVDRKLKQRRFAVKKFGEQEAFRLACECRASMMAIVQHMGAGYTESHLSRAMVRRHANGTD